MDTLKLYFYKTLLFFVNLFLIIFKDKIWYLFFWAIFWGVIFGWTVGIMTFAITYFLEFSQAIYDLIKRLSH